MVSQARGPIRTALATTISTIDVEEDAAAIVALCERTADLLDRVMDGDTHAKLAAGYLRQLSELRAWRAVEVPALFDEAPAKEDPFDALAKALAKGTGTE